MLFKSGSDRDESWQALVKVSRNSPLKKSLKLNFKKFHLSIEKSVAYPNTAVAFSEL